jgi:antitoxin component YwqK of YwqJK toxin-antitoxin module
MMDRRKVPDSDLEISSDQIAYFEGHLFSGVSCEESGVGYSEISYSDGLQHGFSREWYPSGTLRGESIYYKNSRHGPSREYFENGQLREESIYEYDIKVLTMSWNREGQEIAHFLVDRDGNNGPLVARRREAHRWPSPEEVESLFRE